MLYLRSRYVSEYMATINTIQRAGKLFSYMSSVEYKIDFIPVAMSYETHELCLHTGY